MADLSSQDPVDGKAERCRQKAAAEQSTDEIIGQIGELKFQSLTLDPK